MPLSDLDGSLINGVVGADYKVSDRMVLGLMGTYETSDLEGAVGTTQDTDGWGGGAYMGLSLTDNLVLSATILGTELDTDVNGTAEFDSTRIQATSALTGNFYSGTWRYFAITDCRLVKGMAGRERRARMPKPLKQGSFLPACRLAIQYPLAAHQRLSPGLARSLIGSG